MNRLLTLTTVMLVADTVWLTATAESSRKMIAGLQGRPLSVRFLPAALVYVIMIGAAWFFAVLPASSPLEAAGRGAALGFSMYGLYDLTNYATLVRYPLWFTLTDMAWGTVLIASASGLAAL